MRSEFPRTRWSTTDHLLALNVELTSALTRLMFAGFRFEGQMPEPIVITRPGDDPIDDSEDDGRPQSPPEKVAAFFGGSVRFTSKG